MSLGEIDAVTYTVLSTGSTTTPQPISFKKVCSIHKASETLFVSEYSEAVSEYVQSFDDFMNSSGPAQWCEFHKVYIHYDDLQYYLETCAEELGLPYPNELAHNALLNTHGRYFKNCSLNEEHMDPPENVLLALIFAPICIFPFLVALVVYKSNTSKPQT
ncbi:receptor activity-modifying protein 2 isoform X2 [Hyperolius riggenbachi]|uniref:receptor activity-modifying protein 2 isoform X2 n=1 Tax=Hyperolius riggenbachi TaxID=752182 RepID=UPI0035A323C3